MVSHNFPLTSNVSKSRKSLLTVISDEYKCAVRFSIRGEPVAYQWYGLWAAAVAATIMCVAEGKTGLAAVTCMCSEAHEYRE